MELQSYRIFIELTLISTLIYLDRELSQNFINRFIKINKQFFIIYNYKQKYNIDTLRRDSCLLYFVNTILKN